MYDALIEPATLAEADRILAAWGASDVAPLETRNAVWPAPLVQVMGDFPPPSRDEVVHRAKRLLRLPAYRDVARLLDLRGMRSARVPDDRLDDLVEELFVEGALPWSAGAEAIAQAELARPLAVLPFRMVIGDRYVATRRSHAFGDLYGGSRSFPPFLLPDDDAPAPVAYRAPLARALAHTVGRHPGALVAALRSDRWEPEAQPADGPPVVWERGLCYATSESGWLADLRASLDPARESLGGWISAALHRAVAEAGIATHPGTLVVADCRRYLPPAKRHLSGNFVAGSFLRMSDPTDPVVATAAIREYTSSARPLLAMAASRISDARSARAAVPEPDAQPDPQGRAYLALSHCSRLPWPSTTVPVAGCAYQVPTAIGPDGISVVTMVIGDRLSVSIGYAAGRYDRTAIEHIAATVTGQVTGRVTERPGTTPPPGQARRSGDGLQPGIGLQLGEWSKAR